MLRNCLFVLLILISFPSYGNDKNDESSEQSGYRYIIENYFSKRNTDYYGQSRFFSLYGGLSFYREHTDRSLKPFSSLTFGFNQLVTAIPYVGDFSLQAAVRSMWLKETRRSTLLEITPRISIPEIKTIFPIYTGFGFGFGYFPHHDVKQIPAFSFHSEFFVGIRFLDVYHNIGFFTELNLRVHSPSNELKKYLELLNHFGVFFRF